MFSKRCRFWCSVAALILVLAVMVSVLAACDDDDDNEATSSQVETPTTKPPTTASTTAQSATTAQPTTTGSVAECDLTINSKMGDLLDNPDAKAILEEHLPADIMAKAGLVRGFALPVLAPQSDAVTDEMVAAIAGELEALCGGGPVGELLTIDSKLGDLLDNPDAKAILEKHLPADIMAKAGLVRGFALPELAPQSDAVTDEILEAIAADLEALEAYSAAPATTTAPTKTTSALTGEPVKIGVLIAYTGPTGMAGLLLDQVLEVVDYYLEERGGILEGRPVQWEKFDTGGDIATAQSGCRKLAGDDDVVALTIGGVTAGELTSGVILSSELKIPFFTMATFEDMTEYPYAIRSGTVMQLYRAELCSEYALDNCSPDTVAFLGVNTDDAHNALAYAKGIFEDAGVETVYEQYIPYDTTDASPYLTRIKAEEPDVLVTFIDNNATVQSLFKQITGLGGWGDIEVISIGTGAIDAAAETGAQGTYFWASWLPGLPYAGAQKFEQAWQAVHSDTPNSLHGFIFTTLWAAVEAVDQAGADREDIAKLIRSGTFGFESIGGPMVIGTDGEPSIKGFIGLIKDGETMLAP